MEARDIKEIDAERLELIRQMEQLLSCPCRLFRPAAFTLSYYRTKPDYV